MLWRNKVLSTHDTGRPSPQPFIDSLRRSRNFQDFRFKLNYASSKKQAIWEAWEQNTHRSFHMWCSVCLEASQKNLMYFILAKYRNVLAFLVVFGISCKTSGSGFLRPQCERGLLQRTIWIYLVKHFHITLYVCKNIVSKCGYLLKKTK